tara:strand:+ start:1626 stop:1817 length:192 start_codon:yes stop_codon:yes gene_type:complete
VLVVLDTAHVLVTVVRFIVVPKVDTTTQKLSMFKVVGLTLYVLQVSIVVAIENVLVARVVHLM